jgi:acyl-CoA synthetase (AMP-forming)/AMP-acid ligase II
VYLLDESLKPILDLRVGEIFVGGEGLARAYWKRPELTAEKFLEVEVEPQVFTRLYRTGDLGRYNKAGLLEFVGRTDFQVKIRGFRVEPEEIELALSAMPGIASAAVVARGKSPESKQLCCYYVPDKTLSITADAVKMFLKGQFPDYMVPATFRELPSLPRNTNDKVDRTALENLMITTNRAASTKKVTPVDPQPSVTREVPRQKPADQGAGLLARVQRAIRKAAFAFHIV